MVLLLAAVSLGALTGFAVASAAGLGRTSSVDHQLGALRCSDRRPLVVKAAAGEPRW